MIFNRTLSISTAVLITSLLLLSIYPAFVKAADSPLMGKTIALDSGHGESETSFGTSGF